MQFGMVCAVYITNHPVEYLRNYWKGYSIIYLEQLMKCLMEYLMEYVKQYIVMKHNEIIKTNFKIRNK